MIFIMMRYTNQSHKTRRSGMQQVGKDLYTLGCIQAEPRGNLLFLQNKIEDKGSDTQRIILTGCKFQMC